MIRVGLLSFWHVHAPDYAKQIAEHPDTELAAVWDEDAERGREEAKTRGVPYYDSLERLLAADDIDAVVVTAPTSRHRQVLIQAAEAHKHIFTEKVVAATEADCRAVLDVVQAQEVAMVVSLPRLYHGYTLSIQRMLSQNALGALTQVRTRLSHDGTIRHWLPERFYDPKTCEGGALIDLGCHPMYLARLFLGMPKAISAHFGYVAGNPVEDNAVAVLQYDSGALGIVEAGFVSDSSADIAIYGTRGSLIFSQRERKLLHHEASDDRTTWREIPIARDALTAFEQWVQHIQAGTRAEENLAMALDLSRLMEAAYASARTSATVSLV